MSLRRRLGKAGRRWLLLFHRWAGIAAGLFFASWIGSGLVMLYVPFPTLTAAERAALRAEGFAFYDWDGDAARLVCAWDTPPEHATALSRAIAAL